MGDLIGKYGLERLMDNVLRGVNGGRKVEVDAAGRDQRLVEEVPSRAGGAVHTSLDVDLQVTAQEALGTRAGAVIALAPRTGEVLAFYSGPAFDPNAFARGIRKADWQALNTDPRKPMQNKGLQGTYAPGSTIKPFLAMTALEEKMQEKGKPVLCPGSFRLGNRVFRCWREKGHGAVDMYRAIVQSCDVYFYTLGLKLGPDRVAKLEKGAGLGTITGIDLPGGAERAGPGHGVEADGDQGTVVRLRERAPRDRPGVGTPHPPRDDRRLCDAGDGRRGDAAPRRVEGDRDGREGA